MWTARFQSLPGEQLPDYHQTFRRHQSRQSRH